MRQKSRLSLDSWSTGGWTSASVLQILVTSIGIDTSGGGNSLEVTITSGVVDHVTDFLVSGLLHRQISACLQAPLSEDALTYAVW